MRVRIELGGLFGIGARHMYYPGFAARTVEWDKPFISESGFRSFLGLWAEPFSCILPHEFCCKVIQTYISEELKGKLRVIAPRPKPKHGQPAG